MYIPDKKNQSENLNPILKSKIQTRFEFAERTRSLNPSPSTNPFGFVERTQIRG